jgi:hypothetical protein
MSMDCTLYSMPDRITQALRADPDQLEGLLAGKKALSLQKRWDGLHFVLTGTGRGKLPLGFLASGGETVGEEDVEDEDIPARILSSAQVKKLDRALAPFTRDEFERRFDVERLAKARVYPNIWDEPRASLVAEYWGNLEALRAFVHEAAEASEAIVIRMD